MYRGLADCCATGFREANGLHKMKPDDTCYPGTANVKPVVMNRTWLWDVCAERIFDKMKFPQQEQTILFFWDSQGSSHHLSSAVFSHPPGYFCQWRRLISWCRWSHNFLEGLGGNIKYSRDSVCATQITCWAIQSKKSFSWRQQLKVVWCATEMQSEHTSSWIWPIYYSPIHAKLVESHLKLRRKKNVWLMCRSSTGTKIAVLDSLSVMQLFGLQSDLEWTNGSQKMNYKDLKT